MLWSFGEAHPIFWQLREDVQKYTYTDAQYTKIYKIILESINSLHADHAAADLSKLQQLHQVLMQIRQQEADFLHKEGDPDQWLDKALSQI